MISPIFVEGIKPIILGGLHRFAGMITPVCLRGNNSLPGERRGGLRGGREGFSRHAIVRCPQNICGKGRNRPSPALLAAAFYALRR